MFPSIDPGRMTPRERLQEVAAILSRGLVRMQTTGTQTSSARRQIPLDFGRETSPHVSTVNVPREPLNEG